MPGQEVSEGGTAGAAHGMEEWEWVAPLLSEGFPEQVRQDPGWWRRDRALWCPEAGPLNSALHP